MKFNIQVPTEVKYIIERLNQYGYDAYIVGGCVRDSILHKNPKDWDVCTSATPEQMIKVFKNNKIIPTGLKHGTLTIIIDDMSIETTTFRVDGDYDDNRRPNTVTFTTDILQDLSRRDFTVNAMAYHHTTGLIDPFNGIDDIKNRMIRCVGNANDRFNEDALRILRALRFSSVYDFDIESNTAYAIHKNKALLDNIAAERINTELCKMLCGAGILNILLNYNDIIATIIPEIKQCIGFNQNNPYHQYTVYDHIAHAVSNYTGSDIVIKVALLLHDIGKPICYTENDSGGHFYGHGIPSSSIAESVVKRLRFDNQTQHDVVELVLYHDAVIDPTEKVVKRWLNKIGERQLFKLLDIRMADILAHAEETQSSRIDRCVAVKKIAKDIIASQQCFCLKDMQISGNDLIKIGMQQGKQIGNTLRYLLDMIINGEVENEKEKLINIVKLHNNIIDAG